MPSPENLECTDPLENCFQTIPPGEKRLTVDHQFMFIKVRSFVNPHRTSSTNEYKCLYIPMYIFKKYIYTYQSMYIYIYKMQLRFTHNLADLNAENLKQTKVKLFKNCAKARK